MPPPPVRELWTPPPGWRPPTPPVQSWYDAGKRLTVAVPETPAAAAAPAASTSSSPAQFFDDIAKGFSDFISGLQGGTSTPSAPTAATARKGPWPSKGGKAGFHRGAGTMPAPPARELWNPPPGWTAPSVKKESSVASW